MANNEEGKQIQFKGIGDNDQVIYQKADVVKACRVGANFAIGFYQVDYQAIVNSLAGLSTIKPDETKLMPVSKIVLDPAAFQKLRAELNEIAAKLPGGNVVGMPPKGNQ